MPKNKGQTTVDIDGCIIETAKTVLKDNVVLDPCNCSSYYNVSSEHSRLRQICLDGYLWNHDKNICDQPKTVLDRNLCDLHAPWDRCQGLTDASRRQMKKKCIKEGFYTITTDDQASASADSVVGYIPLPRETQLANVELAFASMVAGCVITLMIVAMVMEFCSFPHLGKTISGQMKKKFSVRNRSKPVADGTVDVADGDKVSVDYEYINEEEGIFNTGFTPGLPHASVENKRDQGKTGRQVNIKFQSESQTSHHISSSETSRKPQLLPTQTSAHMGPKTKNTPLKKERGGNIAGPSRPLQLEPEVSAEYIHPVYN